MFSKGEVISDDADLDYCIFLKKAINVWQQQELIDYGGVPEEYSDEAVKINGAYYLRSACQFKVR